MVSLRPCVLVGNAGKLFLWSLPCYLLGGTVCISFDTEKLFLNYLFTSYHESHHLTDGINCIPTTIFSLTFVVVMPVFYLAYFFSCVFGNEKLLCPSNINSNTISVFPQLTHSYKVRMISLVCSIISLCFLVALCGLLCRSTISLCHLSAPQGQELCLIQLYFASRVYQ